MMSIFFKLGWYFKREWKLYLVGIIGLILTAVIGIIPPRIIGDVIDGINKHSLTVHSLTVYLSIMVVSAVGQYLTRFLWRTAIWGGAAGLERTLRERLFWHFMKMDATFYQKYRTGDLMGTCNK